MSWVPILLLLPGIGIEGNFQSNLPLSFISLVISSDHKFGEGADQISPPNLLSSLLALRDNRRTNIAKINMSKPMLLSDFLFCF